MNSHKLGLSHFGQIHVYFTPVALHVLFADVISPKRTLFTPSHSAKLCAYDTRGSSTKSKQPSGTLLKVPRSGVLRLTFGVFLLLYPDIAKLASIRDLWPSLSFCPATSDWRIFVGCSRRREYLAYLKNPVKELYTCDRPQMELTRNRPCVCLIRLRSLARHSLDGVWQEHTRGLTVLLANLSRMKPSFLSSAFTSDRRG